MSHGNVGQGPCFSRKWLQKPTNGYKIGPNKHNDSGATMNEEIRHATDIAKDPASLSVLSYVLMMALAFWGGVVRVIREIALTDKSLTRILGIFVAEMCVSGFAGTITFALCLSMDVSFAYTGALTAMAGYMGGRSLSLLESLYKTWKGKL